MVLWTIQPRHIWELITFLFAKYSRIEERINMSKDEMLNKLSHLRYCVLWPGDWEDVGFTERPIWVNHKGYGYYSCDVPCSFMQIENLTDQYINSVRQKLSNGMLTVEDIKGSPLGNSPFAYDTFVDEEALESFLDDFAVSPISNKETFFCGEDMDGWYFFETEEDLIKAFEMDYCDSAWDEMDEHELSEWCTRLFEEEQDYELPIHLSILLD